MSRLSAIVSGFVLCAGTAIPAHGQITRIINEVSTDGGLTWSSHVDAAPGSRVDVRIRVALQGATALGFGGINFRPTLSNWRSSSGDTHIPFSFPGLSSSPTDGSLGTPTTETSFEGRHVHDVPVSTGRMFPFGAAGMFESSATGLPTAFNDPGNVLRISGFNYDPTLHPAAGVLIGQWPQDFSGTHFNSSLDVVVFKYAVMLGSESSTRTLSATVPLTSITNRRASWLLNESGGSSIQYGATASSIASATITVPTPNALCLAPWAWFLVRPRRRR